MGWKSIIGSAVGGGLSFLGGERANAATARDVKRQIDFQEKAYRNRYQWTMEDMRAAGLNPMLAYQTGVGSAPSGAAGVYRDTISPAVGSAKEAAIAAETLKNIKADTSKKWAESYAAQTHGILMTEKHGHAILETEIYKAMAAAAKQDKKIWSSRAGNLLRWLDKIGTSVNPFTSSAKDLQTLTK